MSREYRFFLEDMRKACDKVIRFTQQITREQFVADDKTFDAVMRDLEIIGEASKHIPPEARTQHPDIDWHKSPACEMWWSMSTSGLILKSFGTL